MSFIDNIYPEQLDHITLGQLPHLLSFGAPLPLIKSFETGNLYILPRDQSPPIHFIVACLSNTTGRQHPLRSVRLTVVERHAAQGIARAEDPELVSSTFLPLDHSLAETPYLSNLRQVVFSWGVRWISLEKGMAHLEQALPMTSAKGLLRFSVD